MSRTRRFTMNCGSSAPYSGAGIHGSPVRFFITRLWGAMAVVARRRCAGRRASRRRASGLAPNRDVLFAIGGERRAVPAGIAGFERHAGDPRHEVELGGPDVAVRKGRVPNLAVPEREVVRDPALADEVEFVDAPVPFCSD